MCIGWLVIKKAELSDMYQIGILVWLVFRVALSLGDYSASEACIRTRLKNPWYVLVNSRKIETTPVITNEECDESGEYWFREGELAYITCFKPDGVMHMDFLKFEGNSTNKPIIQDSNYQTLSVILTKNYDGTSVNCTYYHIKDHGITKFAIVQLHLRMIKDKAKSDISFIVNNMELVPSWNDSQIFYTYHYGEEGTVSIRSVTPLHYEGLTCSSENILDVPKIRGVNCKSPSIVTKALRRGNSGQTITFSANESATVSVTFYYVGDNDEHPVIVGLQQKGIHLKYNPVQSSEHIVYRHETSDKNIELTCQFGKTGCKWIYNAQEVQATETNNTSDKIWHLNLRMKSLYTIVECNCGVNLQNWDVKSVVEILNDDQSLIPESETNTKQTIHRASEKEMNRAVLTVIVISALVVVSFVIGMIVAILKWKKRRVKAQASSEDREDVMNQYERIVGVKIGERDNTDPNSDDVSKRPCFPLPAEASQEKYKHYDTVYEFRLDQMIQMQKILGNRRGALWTAGWGRPVPPRPKRRPEAVLQKP